MKFPGVISLRNALPICAMPNGRLPARDLGDVLEVDEDALRRLRARGRRPAPSPRRGPILVENIRLNWRGSVRSHCSVSPGCLLGRCPHWASLELVGSVAALAEAAVDERVGEAGDVPRSLPDGGVEDDRRVEGDDVVPLAHHRLEPARLDVLLEQDAVVAVVVRRAEAAVDLARREDEPAPLRERDDLVHRDHVGHPRDVTRAERRGR